MLVENYIGKKELEVCKVGFTWKYVVEEKSTDGGRQTVITCEIIHKSAFGFARGIPYPFDSGRREDATVDAIRAATANLHDVAHETNVPVREYGSRTIIGQNMTGKVVQEFIADLARINRVLVVMSKVGTVS